jgi:CDP-diacylglycerol---serine O-phosphatidyltransferase
MKKAIPNIITLLNLISGCIGLYFILVQKEVNTAVYMVFIAAVLDFADGFVARALKVSGELGKQLDSLADMVTFGVLPGAIAWSMSDQSSFAQFASLLIPAFSALRLAKFNIDTRQSDTFIGVPTPMNTFMWCGLVTLYQEYTFVEEWINNPYVFSVVCLAFSIMMVVNLPMLALKFKKKDKQLVFKLILIILSVLSIILFGIGGLFMAYLIYVLLSLTVNYLER